MLWSLVLLVVCLLLAASVFLVAGVMANPGGVTTVASPRERIRAGLRHLRAQREARIPGRGRATAVAHHAVGAPTVWVGRQASPAGHNPRPAAPARPPRASRTSERPVDMDMEAFFAATIEAKPAYVDPAELTDALQRARAQASRTLHVPLGTISRPR
ncbi:hypothetical protein [Antribacter gilvus]|uniref:hypothetical protein n=1 Tax=Antribacter gilvus TaxID=2304675 RepID=UPI000F7B32E6|nr:hypothetical protein [Antribacter gilvus]